MKKVNVLKLKLLEHNGLGDGARHTKIIHEFGISEERGIAYCLDQGYEVQLREGLLTVIAPIPYGFKMVALIEKIEV